MNDQLSALRVFVRVAQAGSFSAAARDLGLSQPSISRIVASLERELGASLLKRTTRAVTLTVMGEEYLQRIQPLLAGLDEADQWIRGPGELRGSLCIAAPASFASRELIPVLPGFLERHPALRVNLLMSDQRQEMVREGVDVALRFGALDDSTMTARLIGRTARMLLAAPAYLSRRGTPLAPEDLGLHTVVRGPAAASRTAWSFTDGSRTVEVDAPVALTVSTNEGALAAALAGIGIVSTSGWSCRDELANGTLVQVLEQWRAPEVEMHALFAPGRSPAPSARAFVDYLLSTLRL